MILVTGGTGLVGAHLLLELLGSDNKVRAIHRKNSDLRVVKKVFSYYMSSEEAEACFHKIDWQEANILDVQELSRAFTGVSEVYHCAALVSFDSSRVNELRKTNIEGTANVVNVSLSSKVRKLCYISSIAAMDAGPGVDIITEDFSWFPEKKHSE
jgi:nucleoside-diphosphate-sugar epimerase